MTDADLWSAWTFWMAVAGVIILIAAALLVVIWLTARSILAHAVRALNAAEAIRQNTQPIWQLQATNEVAEDLLRAVQSIATTGGAMVDAVEGRDHAPAKR